MLKFSHIKFLTDTNAPWKYGFSKTYSYFSSHNAEPQVIQPGNCPWRILVRLDIICATSYPGLCEDPLPLNGQFPLFQTLTFQLSDRLRSQGKKSSPPSSSNAVRAESLPDTLIPPYQRQHHLRHTLRPQQQHYAVLDVLSLVWECVVPHCCLLMECRQ